MFDALARVRSSLPRPTLRTVATAPLRPRTYASLAYLALAFPLGLAYFLFVTVGVAVSLGLSLVLIGIPLFLLVLAGTVVLVTLERRLTSTLLDLDVAAPAWRFESRDSPFDGVKRLVTDPMVWQGLVLLPTKLVVGVIAFSLASTLLTPALALVATPLYYRTPGVRVGVFLPTDITRELSLYIPWNELLVGASFVVRFTSWQVTTIGDALLLSGLGVVALVLALAFLDGVAWLCGQWTRVAFGAPLTDRFR